MKTVSIVIPTWNRGHLLKNSLNRLCNLTLPDEVLIIDDGSTDNTEQVVDSFKDKLPIRYIYNHSPGYTMCTVPRNIGLKNAQSELLICTEPEILFVSDLVKEMVNYYEQHNKVVSVGTVYHSNQNSIISSEFFTDPKHALTKEVIKPHGQHVSSKEYVLTTGWVASFCVLYKKEWLMNINGWDEGFEGIWGWDDTDLMTRLRLSGVASHINNDFEAIHQWHPRAGSFGKSDGQHLNEKRFKSKHFENELNNPNVIANQNKEWGIIKQR